MEHLKLAGFVIISTLMVTGFFLLFIKKIYEKTLFFSADNTDERSERGWTRLSFGMANRYEGQDMRSILEREGGTPPEISKAIEKAKTVFIYLDPYSPAFNKTRKFLNCLSLEISVNKKYENTNFIILVKPENLQNPEILQERDKLRANLESEDHYRNYTEIIQENLFSLV